MQRALTCIAAVAASCYSRRGCRHHDPWAWPRHKERWVHPRRVERESNTSLQRECQHQLYWDAFGHAGMFLSGMINRARSTLPCHVAMSTVMSCLFHCTQSSESPLPISPPPPPPPHPHPTRLPCYQVLSPSPPHVYTTVPRVLMHTVFCPPPSSSPRHSPRTTFPLIPPASRSTAPASLRAPAFSSTLARMAASGTPRSASG